MLRRSGFLLCAMLVLLISATSLFAASGRHRSRSGTHASPTSIAKSLAPWFHSSSKHAASGHPNISKDTGHSASVGALNGNVSGDGSSDTSTTGGPPTASGWHVGGSPQQWLQKIIDAKRSWTGSTGSHRSSGSGRSGSNHGPVTGGPLVGVGGTKANPSTASSSGTGSSSVTTVSGGSGSTTANNITPASSGGTGSGTAGTTAKASGSSGSSASATGSTPPVTSGGNGSTAAVNAGTTPSNGNSAGTGGSSAPVSAGPAPGTDPPGVAAVGGASSGSADSGGTSGGSGPDDPAAMAPPGSGETRDPALWPFAPTSPWNYPIGSNAQYVGFNWRDSSKFLGSPGIGIDPNVTITFTAKATDPIRNFINNGWGGEVWPRRVPDNATPVGGERFMTVIDERHLSALDLYYAQRQANGSWTASGGLWNVDLKGQGWNLFTMCLNPPPSDNNQCHGQSRAAGTATFAGAVRPGELTNGIKHALAAVVGGNFLNRTPGGDGHVWPAVTQDDNWQSTYQGKEVTNLYMGGLFAIPLSVDVNSLGLKLPQSLNLAKALQQYGAYVVDRGEAQADFILDWKTEPEWAPWYNDPNWRSDMNKIAAVCRIVANSSAPGGGRPRSGVKLDGGDGALRAPTAPNFDR